MLESNSLDKGIQDTQNQVNIEKNWNDFYKKCPTNRYETFFDADYEIGLNAVMDYLAKNEGKENIGIDELSQIEAEGAIKLCGIKKGDLILNVPCGRGRHDLHFISKGINVVGGDSNLLVIKKAKDNLTSRELKQNMLDGKNKRGKIKYETIHMNDIHYTNTFDVVTNLMYSIGYYPNDDENKKVLQEFYKSLKQGGKLIIQTSVPLDKAEKGYYDKVQRTELLDSRKLLIQKQYDLESKKMNGIWTFFSKHGEMLKQQYYSTQIYSDQDFENNLKEVGFKDIHIYGNRQGAKRIPFDSNVIIVAHK